MKYYPQIILFVLILIGCKYQQPEIDLIITDVSVIDIISGEILENQDVIIHDSTIIEIVNSDESNLNLQFQ